MDSWNDSSTDEGTDAETCVARVCVCLPMRCTKKIVRCRPTVPMRDGVSPQRDNCTNATVRSVVLLVHWAYQAGRKGTRANPFCRTRVGCRHTPCHACYCTCHGERESVSRTVSRIIIITSYKPFFLQPLCTDCSNRRL